ncbi:ABC transporter permease [Conexibacter stalactiti]|uniref:ABC transporter permease n=1 Tax=Conexibacter stalactiti TaxID=1940611 RepID=A0ABU4HP67_9ACTN|nr:ABC transporter permease [Conexibacter stalactiti]MDW5594509.1 ABC transporter permease [Conexibacter stalactiti]MEC5035151.1 ABC transporter permease [Conexibacter stalactiti]
MSEQAAHPGTAVAVPTQISPLRWLRAFVRTPYFAIWPATALLFAVSPILASGSLDGSALLGMLPFAAILALVAAGQTLIVQQGGLDLSVPGMVSLSAVIVSKYPQGSDGRLLAAVAIALGACALAALISGIAITRFGITPLIATLGVNALLTGAVLQYTSGSASDPAPPALVDLASGKVAGIPNTVVIAVVLIALATFVVRRTILGRRFVAAGASPRAAVAAGIRVREHQLGTYVVAGLLYAAAGILLAGFLETPGLQPGQQYLLPSIAAVVLGGTALTGGSGSVAATAVGALFLTQLNQVVLGMGAASSVQLLIQGLIIALGMGLRNVPWAAVRRALPSGRVPTSQRSD